MKRLAFIDHSFHKQSLATIFLVDLLKQDYEVEIFWDESWSDGPRVDFESIKSQNFEILVLFQQMRYYTVEELRSLDCAIILVPMFDDVGGRPDTFWFRYRNFKFINFSKTLHYRLQNLGIETLYCQYFIPPLHSVVQNNSCAELKGFFWQRRGEITWQEVKILIGQSNFRSFHIHTAVDPPGYELILPSEEDSRKYSVSTSQWFSSKDEYTRIVSEAQVYFAPRLYEGIGMGFIEAMAMGKCVVAPNNPTMNEYITHGENGLLYDPEDPQPLDFSNVETLCQNAKKYIEHGYKGWPRTCKKITCFIAANPRRFRFLSFRVLWKRIKLRIRVRPTPSRMI